MRIPAASPPDGYTQDFENPELKHVTAGIWVTVIGMVVMTLFLLLRVYTKAILARSFGIDDVALIAAWVISIALQSMVVYLWIVQHIGVHIWNLYQDEVNETMLLLLICRLLQTPLMALAKLALLSFYRKLSLDRWFTYAVWGVMGFIISSSVAVILAMVFACSPLELSWDYTTQQHDHCINRAALSVTAAGLNVATDVLLLLLTLPMICRLQVPMVQKMGLVAMFTIGSLTLVTSLIRLGLLPQAINSTDPTWAVSTLALWICVDANLIVVCGCLPILRLFFRHVAPRLIGESSPRSASEPHTQKSAPGVAELSTLSSRPKTQQDYDLDLWEKDADLDNGSETFTMDSTGRILPLPRTSIPSMIPDDVTDWPLPAVPQSQKRGSGMIWYGVAPTASTAAAPSFAMARDDMGRLSIQPR